MEIPRMNSLVWIVGIGVMLGALHTPAGAQTPLISRDVLFGNPERGALRVSDDGKMVSYLAPVDGVMNVWVAPIDNLSAAKVVTHDKKRGIMQYRWAYTNQHIIYSQDEGGNENWNVHVVDLATARDTNLTPNEKATARIQQMSDKFPDEILIAINDRDPRFHDIWRVNIRSGEKKLLQQNPGSINDNVVAGFVTDDDYTVRFAVTYMPDGGQEILQPDNEPEKKDEVGGWESFTRIPLEDTMTTDAEGFDKTGDVLYMTDSRGRDTGALVALNLKTGDQKLLAENPKADASTVLVHPRNKNVQAVAFNRLRSEWDVIDPAIAPDFEYLKTLGDGEVAITSRTADDKKWTVALIPSDGPIASYLYDRDAKKAELIFTSRKALADLKLAKMHPLVIKSRDGLDLVCYLTLPVDSDPDSTGKPNHPLPLVLDIHGGPWARDSYGFNPYHQWLANRGYAVISVNYRGSTGFGKEFVNAGNKEWAGKMHDDLLDVVNWAVENKIAQKDKVAIMGGSYGGYATLVGLTFTPDVFACGVDIVGPSNINTLLATIPPYWTAGRSVWKYRVGDSSTTEGREFLDSRSPLTKVDQIKKPLLIGQGANDPRVKQSESDQIVKAMQEKKIPVTYVVFPDEGHGFARPENRTSFNAVVEAFLAEHLGGRCQPIGDDFKGSSIKVEAGADQVTGVAEAIKAAQSSR